MTQKGCAVGSGLQRWRKSEKRRAEGLGAVVSQACSADPALALLHSNFFSMSIYDFITKITGAHTHTHAQSFKTQLLSSLSRKVTPYAVTVTAHMGRALAEIQMQQGICIKAAGICEQQIRLGSSLLDNTGVSNTEWEQNEKCKLGISGLLYASEISEERMRRWEVRGAGATVVLSPVLFSVLPSLLPKSTK